MSNSNNSPFSPVSEVIEEIKAGRFVILVDDADRENEGDLVCAAELVTPQMINFMIRQAAGKLCLPLTAETCERLHLYPQASENTAQHGTAFTISIDVKPQFGITTGVSAADRCTTIKRCLADDAKPSDFDRPGHISPLKGRPGGVLVRAGHTEASIDLAQLAGLKPAGVIIEILKENGEIARLDDLVEFANKHGLKICTIESLIEYRMQRERSIVRLESIPLTNRYGTWMLHAFQSMTDVEPHVALCMGNIGGIGPDGEAVAVDHAVLVRAHSQCLTGDVFGSSRCDCGEQLDRAMEIIAAAGEGVILYLRQEGRGIGLRNKLHAYRLQDEGLDTVEANQRLGFPADKRDYGIGAQMLRDLGVRRIRILTNNPKKTSRLQVYGLDVVDQLPLRVASNPDNRRYLNTKRDKLGHTLDEE
ncbi:MAG TPA: bifunctional 3,4-dihydroxy-2-butanone-4-phosphate synthase/GTP cyclohydrolase II [Phycisphaerae bacterium]|nr:bifunctional 3,4-dihydroxy-2-butanone-4-phosphate synthase/GTP cyclohydrolase II [Phycisphaerae bacterium]